MNQPLVEVDRYVLCDPIAVGGMATVYFARQRGAAGFSKAVAIKRMRPDLVHQREFVELFVDEARLASRVRHANVVSVTDVVASGDELLLVMDYFPGESLARLLAATKKPVAPDIAVAIICNILHGLHAAHEATGDEGEALGIVHRDVSPQNALVCVDGIARVLDFGIARAAGQLHATDEGKTRGKAGYSAPEQLRGGKVTRKIDIFAASAVLWEMLVGRRLFDGDTQAAVITAVLTEAIDPPGLHLPTLPEALDNVVIRGLDRDPAKRHETALNLANELEKAVPPARPTAVKAWLHELAAEGLAKRDEVVRHIQAGREAPLPTPTPAPTPAVVDTVGSLATSRAASTSPAPRSRAVPIGAAIVAVLVAIGSVAAFTRKPPQPPAVVSTPPPPATGEATPLVSAPPPPIASSAPPVATAKPPKPRPVAAPKAPAVKKPTCEPPYYEDAQGHRIFKTECL